MEHCRLDGSAPNNSEDTNIHRESSYRNTYHNCPNYPGQLISFHSPIITVCNCRTQMHYIFHLLSSPLIYLTSKWIINAHINYNKPAITRVQRPTLALFWWLITSTFWLQNKRVSITHLVTFVSTSGDPSCIGFWVVVRKKTQINGSENPTRQRGY